MSNFIHVAALVTINVGELSGSYFEFACLNTELVDICWPFIYFESVVQNIRHENWCGTRSVNWLSCTPGVAASGFVPFEFLHTDLEQVKMRVFSK